MTTHTHIDSRLGWLRPAAGVLTGVLLGVGVQAQQVSTVLSSGLLTPSYVTVDSQNNIYFTDSDNNRIVEYIPSTNGVLTFAGYPGPAYSGTANGLGEAARFNQPAGIVYDPSRGGLVVVDQGNQVLRYISLIGSVSNLAGVEAQTPFEGGGHVDGPAATAKFSSFMTGIATDGAGNLYIADSGNDAIRRLDISNNVSTLYVTNYTFNQPNSVIVDDSGNLWIADTKNSTICIVSNISVFTNQSVTIVAGAKGVPGTNDSLYATNALFYYPSSLLWDPNGAGLFISDTLNQTVRRLWANPTQGGAFSVQTVAGLPGQPGFVSGALNVAKFDNPVGLCVDVINSGYYVVDRANNALRRLQSTAPQPPISDPRIGFVTFVAPPTGGPAVSVFNAATNETFFNAAIIAIEAEDGVQTYMTYGATPPNSYVNTIPAPGPKTGTSPSIYPGDGNLPPIPSVLAPAPDVTMYVACEAPGRQSSDIASARFRFVTANPNIGGVNAEVVPLTDSTANALMWYTLDGTTPTNDGSNGIGPITNGQVISFIPLTNTTMTVAAFARGFAPSGTVVQVFYPSNFVACSMTFGFASGEASSEFVGAAGARFYAPVTLSLLPGASMYSLQFNVTVTNVVTNHPSAPVPPGGDYQFRFDSMLVKPTNINGVSLYVPIPPAMFIGFQTNVLTNITFLGTNALGDVFSTNIFTNFIPQFDSLLFTNSTENLLGVGWLEIPPQINLYDSTLQNLITYSLAHETLLTPAQNEVIVGGYSFVIPTSAPIGSQYQIQIGRPSADANGFAQAVFIDTLTNGSLGAGPINSTKNVTVGVIPYLVGDVAPFHWFNAGDFGDSNLLNNDVLEVFRSAIYNFNTPPKGSDFYDAYDSSDGSLNNLYTGDSSAINNIKFGDGLLDVSDVFVTFQRSLDPSLTWYERFWSNGTPYAVPVLNTNPTTLTVINPHAPATAPTRQVLGSGPRYVTVGADRVVGVAGQAVQVPVRVLAADTLPITVMMLNVTLVPLDGSPSIASTVAFTPNAGLGSPALTDSLGAGDYSGAWLNASASGVSGPGILGTITVTLPATANANSSYLVHFGHFSASPNGLASFHATVNDGLITVGSARTASSWNDGIPDWWRLVWFGTVSNVLSAANLDPDGDGASNWQEYAAGTNPQNPASVLRATSTTPLPNFTVQWPSIAGKNYTVQSAASLSAATWTTIASGLAGTGQMMQLSDTNLPAPPARFYRVLVQ